MAATKSTKNKERKGAKVQSKMKDTKQKKEKTQPGKSKGKDVKEVRKPALKMKAPGGERKEPRHVTFAGTKVVNQGKQPAAPATKEKKKLDVKAIQETINKMADDAAARRKEAAATAKKDAKAEKIVALNAKVQKVLPKIKSPSGVTTPPCRVRSKSSPRPSPTESGTGKRKGSLEAAAKKAQAVAELDAQEGMMTFLEDLKKELQVRGESVSDSVAAILKSKVLDTKEAEGSDDNGSNADTEADDDEEADEGEEEGGGDASAREEDEEDEEDQSVAEEEGEGNGSDESEAEEEDEKEDECEEEEDDDEEEGDGEVEEGDEDEAEGKAKGKGTELAKVTEATKEKSKELRNSASTQLIHSLGFHYVSLTYVEVTSKKKNSSAIIRFPSSFAFFPSLSESS